MLRQVQSPPRCVVNAYNAVVRLLPLDVRQSVGAAAAVHGLMDGGTVHKLGAECASIGASPEMHIAMYRLAICRLVARVMVLVYSQAHAASGKLVAAAAYNRCDDAACRAGNRVHASMFEHTMHLFANAPRTMACAGAILDRAFDASVERDFFFGF